MTPAFFYGVWPGTRSGHYLRSPEGEIAWRVKDVFLQRMAAAGRPWGFYPWDTCRDRRPQEQWQWQYYHCAGLSLISCWDRSGDKRMNSCSAFVVQGDLDAALLLGMAHRTFPQVFNRMSVDGIDRFCFTEGGEE